MRKVSGPGPCYVLPTTTGFINHDPTRTQAPAFSFGVVTQIHKVKEAPGPKYDVRGINEHGKLKTQEALILGRYKPTKLTQTPTPRSYNAATTEATAASYSFGNKRPDQNFKVGPGPNKYILPSCVGPHAPDIKTEPAFSILSRNFIKTEYITPGPKYGLPAPNIYLKTIPQATLLGRTSRNYATDVPGPNKYFPKPTYQKQEGLKGITFGVQHSPEKHMFYLPEDREVDSLIL